MKLLQQAVHILEKSGISSAKLDAQLLLAHVLNISREEMLLRDEITINTAQDQEFQELISRRAAFEPVSQILGKREFWGMEFLVNKHTLTPRPDSETLIETLLQIQPNRGLPLQILDLGTGSGCLLLSALSEYPQAQGTGIDISEQAIDIARKNSDLLGFSARADFKKCDWNSQINWNSQIKGVWNVILCNPPYIVSDHIDQLAPDVALYEPRQALDGGNSGLECYRTIISLLPSLMAKEAVVLLESGAGQAKEIAAIAEANGLKIAGTACDLAGIERCVAIIK